MSDYEDVIARDSDPENKIEVGITRGKDGKLVVFIDTPGVPEPSGAPDIRIWINDALIYRSGEIGEDLPVNP